MVAVQIPPLGNSVSVEPANTEVDIKPRDNNPIHHLLSIWALLSWKDFDFLEAILNFSIMEWSNEKFNIYYEFKLPK